MRYPGTWTVTAAAFGSAIRDPALTLTPEAGYQIEGMTLGSRMALVDPVELEDVARALQDGGNAVLGASLLRRLTTTGPVEGSHLPAREPDEEARTVPELHHAVDLHLLQALEAMTRTAGDDRQLVEDRIRDRLVAIHDSFPDLDAMSRRLAYLLRASR